MEVKMGQMAQLILDSRWHSFIDEACASNFED